MPLIRLPQPDGSVRVAVLSLDAWQVLLGFTNVHLEQVVRQAKHLSQAVPDFSDPTVRSPEASNTESALHIAGWHVRESMQRAWGHAVAPLRVSASAEMLEEAQEEQGQQSQQTAYGASSSGHAATPLQAVWAWVDGVPAKALHQPTSATAHGGKPDVAAAAASGGGGGSQQAHPFEGGGLASLTAGAATSAADTGNNAGDEDEDRPLAFGHAMSVIVAGAEVHSEQQHDVLNEQQAVLKALHEALVVAEESGDPGRLSGLVQWLTNEPMSIQMVGLVADLFQKQLELNLIPSESVAQLIEALVSKLGRTGGGVPSNDPPACVEPVLQQLVGIVRSRLLLGAPPPPSSADVAAKEADATSDRLLRQWSRTLLCVFHLYPTAAPSTELHLLRGEIVRQMIHRLSPILQPHPPPHPAPGRTEPCADPTAPTMQHVQLLQVLFEARHLAWFANVHIPASLQTLFQQTERELLSSGGNSNSNAATAMTD
jgi:hypothetical protein